MTDPGLLTSEEIERVRRPYRAASLLPGRAYHDERFFTFERRDRSSAFAIAAAVA